MLLLWLQQILSELHCLEASFYAMFCQGYNEVPPQQCYKLTQRQIHRGKASRFQLCIYYDKLLHKYTTTFLIYITVKAYLVTTEGHLQLIQAIPVNIRAGYC